jgi:hypothetical protein
MDCGKNNERQCPAEIQCFQRVTCPHHQDTFGPECRIGFSTLDSPPWGPPPRPPPRAEPPSPLKSTSGSSTKTPTVSSLGQERRLTMADLLWHASEQH